MTAATASERGRANRRKGADAERAVAKYLRANGFPGAERAVRLGYVGSDRVIPDPGDLTGTPGIVWQVKDCARENIAVWLDDTDRQREQADAEHGVLVVRRRGAAGVGRWWAWVGLGDVLTLANPDGCHCVECAGEVTKEPVRLELGTLVELFRIRGYGDPAVIL